MTKGLQIINITDPTGPTYTGSRNALEYVYEVKVSGSYAYVVDGDSGLQIINKPEITKRLNGIPQSGDAGILSIKVTVDDGKGGSVSDIFNVTVTEVSSSHEKSSVKSVISSKSEAISSSFSVSQLVSSSKSSATISNSVSMMDSSSKILSSFSSIAESEPSKISESKAFPSFSSVSQFTMQSKTSESIPGSRSQEAFSDSTNDLQIL